MNKDSYKYKLIALLPTGPAWPSMQTNNDFTQLLDAMAEELARVDARALNLIEEFFPDTATELLLDWERVAGLPDSCTGELTLLQQRRSSLISVLTIERSLSKQFFIDIAARLGFVITITETLDYVWQVNAFIDADAVYFRVGSSVIGDPLVQSDNTLLECVITILKPAHTTVTFNYT